MSEPISLIGIIFVSLLVAERVIQFIANRVKRSKCLLGEIEMRHTDSIIRLDDSKTHQTDIKKMVSEAVLDEK